MWNEKLKLIKMPEPKSCSVCCIAMLAGISYDEAKQKIFGREKPKRISMNIYEIAEGLMKVGLEISQPKSYPDNTQHDMLCMCKSKSQKWWHYIVYDSSQKKFLDPLPKEWDIDDYQITKCIEIYRR